MESNTTDYCTGHPNICSPIKSLTQLLTCSKQLPHWVKSIIDIVPRSNFVTKNHENDCHTEGHKFVWKERLNGACVPKTLVCHDMKNGYLEDKFVGPVNIGNGYTFYRWSQIDVFVYFSHHLVTIPPLSWINLAHKNGVPILGTFITESTEGKTICNTILEDETTLELYVDILADICTLYKLDGWLLNIENEIEHPEMLLKFVKYLTSKLHAQNANGYVIWYDSVTLQGKLAWQNELNDFNRCYFDVCDGIFLNYTWKEENLKRTVEAAQHRVHDVYVGIDVFGRGCFAGGKFNSYLAAEIIRKHNLSMAIFAQGWTHESLPTEPLDNLLERFYIRDNLFWKSMWPLLYTHPIKHAFETFFHTGVDKEWYNLEKQGIHPSKVLLFKNECDDTENHLQILRDTCDCLQLKINSNHTSCHITNKTPTNNDATSYIHHLFSCEIRMSGDFVLYFFTEEPHDSKFAVTLLALDKCRKIKKIVCKSEEENVTNVSSNYRIIEMSPSREGVLFDEIYKKKLKENWKLRMYHMKFEDIEIVEIGATILSGSYLNLCGLGITTSH